MKISKYGFEQCIYTIFYNKIGIQCENFVANVVHIIFLTWVYKMFIIYFMHGCKQDKVNRKSNLPKIPLKNETNLNINTKSKIKNLCK